MNNQHPVILKHYSPYSVDLIQPTLNRQNVHSDHRIVAVPYIDQLKSRIHEAYLSYMCRDEGQTKNELRFQIEKWLQEYLFSIPHDQKFIFKEFSTCIVNTTNQINVDMQNVCDAFDAIEYYALNLLNYPWRHEYRTLFAFNGYFHLTIASCLKSYIELFELMGFSFDYSSKIFKLTELPIDPDKLTQFAFECFIAKIECKIIMEIHNIVSSSNMEISLHDICNIRLDYVGDVDEAVRKLIDFKQSGKLIDLDAVDYSVKNFKKTNLLSSIGPCLNYGRSTGAFERLQLNENTPQNYLESNLDSLDYIDNDKPIENSEPSYHHKNHNINITQDNPFGLLTHSRPQHFPIREIESSCQNKSIPHSYSADLANPRSKTKLKDIDQMLASEICQFESQKKQHVKNEAKKLDTQHQFTNGHVFPEQKPLKNLAQLNVPNVLSSGWQCSFCTSTNSTSNHVCFMCHKSRSKGSEAIPLSSGGRECSVCTLVNSKDKDNCGACGTSLHDSPTYI